MQKQPQPHQPSSQPHLKNQLSHFRIKSAFQSLQHTERDYLSFDKLAQILDTLCGEQFDRDILEQLWEQCKLNSQGQTKVTTFIDCVISAEAILMYKQNQSQRSLRELSVKIATTKLSHSQKRQITQEMQQIKHLKQGFQIDLYTLRKPFALYTMDTVIRKPASLTLNSNSQEEPSLSYSPYGHSRPHYNSNSVSPCSNLTLVFHLSCVGIIAQLLVYFYIIYRKTVLFLLTISTYLLQQLKKSSIKFLFWLLTWSIAVDLIFFFVSVKHIWKLHELSIWPQYLGSYLKLSVIVLGFVFVLKVFIGILLGLEYGENKQENKMILCGGEVVVKGQEIGEGMFGEWIGARDDVTESQTVRNQK